MSSSATLSHNGLNCCQASPLTATALPRPSTAQSLMRVLEKVSAIALGVFSALINPPLFGAYFLIGAAIGAYSTLMNSNSRPHDHIASACSQSFLEQITGVNLPPPISLAANVAITVCHIDHHANVFVPLTGLFMGAWLGKESAYAAVSLCQKIHTLASRHHCRAALAS